MRTSEDTGHFELDRSRGGWALFWRLYLWSTRNCRPDDSTADETALLTKDHGRGTKDALA